MKTIIQYFTTWWIPIISYLLPFAFFSLGMYLQRDFVIDISLWAFFINFLGNIVSSIVLIINKKWFLIFPQIIISLYIAYYVLLIFGLSPPDFYGTHKIIPKNIEIYKPLDKKITEKDFNSTNFILATIIQPGIYEYYILFKPKELGYIYVKVYEITSNDRLSATRIKKSSMLVIKNLNKEIYSGNFTIYEGDWGDKYGARIEVWFSPNNKNPDYKIFEKNYIVEGWMR